MRELKFFVNSPKDWVRLTPLHISVKQGIAYMLQRNDYILLAGDVSHVHSLAFAQGINTKVHDATNLI